MEIILHLGAHRCANRSFLGYLDGHLPALAAQGLAVWTPAKVRGTLAGVLPTPGPLSADRQFARAAGRIALQLDRLERQGMRRLLIVAPQLLGRPAAGLHDGRLYPGAGARLARVMAAFDGRITRIGLSLRAPDRYWTSVWSMALMQGHGVPEAATLDRLVTQPRSWRALIAELAEAAPGTDLLVMPHERFAGLPEARLAALLADPGAAPPVPRDRARLWLGRAPDLAQLRKALPPVQAAALSHETGGGTQGPWRPFDTGQRAALNEIYQDDLFWLAAGAGGLARLAADPWPPAEEPGPERRDVAPRAPHRDPHGEAQPGRIDPRARLRRRGQGDDIEEGRVGQAG